MSKQADGGCWLLQHAWLPPLPPLPSVTLLLLCITTHGPSPTRLPLLRARLQEFNKYTSLPSSAAAGLLAIVCIYDAGFSWSWGPLGWLVPSEIQAMDVRGAGMGAAVIINFLFTFFIGQAFLSM